MDILNLGDIYSSDENGVPLSSIKGLKAYFYMGVGHASEPASDGHSEPLP